MLNEWVNWIKNTKLRIADKIAVVRDELNRLLLETCWKSPITLLYKHALFVIRSKLKSKRDCTLATLVVVLMLQQ